MKKGFKMLFASLAVVLGMGAAGVAAMTAVKETEKVNADQVWQGHTVMYAHATSYDDMYARVKRGDDVGWNSHYMTKTSYKYGNKYVYSGEIWECYGGLNQMNMKSGYTAESEDSGTNIQTIFTDWTVTSTWADKLYDGSAWKTVYKVDFNMNSHGTAPSGQYVDSGAKASEPTAPTATGYTFGGWYKEAACTNAWNFSSDTVSADTTLYAKWTAIVTEYTITKLAVEFVNGVAQSPADWELGSDSIAEGATYAVPSGVTKNYEHFVGWYTNPACTTAYTARAITGNLTIYAKYERLVVDSYFYWTDHISTDMTHIYFFGEYSPTAWPGDTLSTYLVSSVMSFNGEGKLYRIPVPSNGSYQFVINSGNNNAKTSDTSVTLGSFLYTYWTNDYDGTAWYDTNWNSDAAAAAEVAYLLETKRNAVTAGGGIAAYSICGISTSDANSIITAYNSLTADQKVFFDDTYTYTYDGADTSKQVNVNFSDIMVQLTKNVAGKGALQSIFLNATDSSTSIIVVISALLLAGAAVGGYFLLRKKRVNH